MERTAVTVIVTATEHPDAPQHVAAAQLVDDLWNRWLRIHMRNRVRRAAYDPIFPGGYIDSQAKGALATGAWRYVDGAFRLRFDDALGNARVYAVAAAHFATVSLVVLSLEDNFTRSMRFAGWTFDAHPDPMSTMNDVDTPLIELRGALYVIVGPASAPSLISPHPTQTLEMDALDARERAAVLDAIERRWCQCQLCEYYRPRVPKQLATNAARAARAVEKAAVAEAKAIARAAKKKAP
jgi:hypothetical protein